MPQPLRIGQISYLNVLPLFHHLRRMFPPNDDIQYVSGHPSDMNAGLADGSIDLSPASSFEYLRDAERYRLLPNLSITALVGPVKSVLLVSPVSLDALPAWLAEHGPEVLVTTASASSVALLKVLWSHAWGLPDAQWTDIAPGAGLEMAQASGPRPFLEIGNLALRYWLQPPDGWHIIDLAQAWREFTGLPFVFAVWIVRRGLSEAQQALLDDVHAALMHCKTTCVQAIAEIADFRELSSWINRDGIEDYLSTVGYDLGPNELASLTLFAHHCTQLGLIPGAPALEWA